MTLGRRITAAGLDASAPSRTAVSSTARRIVYADRMVDSASPLRRSSTTQPSTWEGRTLSRDNRPIELLRMWVRATPAYMTLVFRLRSEA
jgi:hypothetical protein